MNISEFCIKRPVFATVLSLVLIVIGIMGLNYLDTRFLPKFEANHIEVEATYPGASAQLVETSITTPIEQAVSGVEGIDSISSTSYQGYSDITISVKSTADLNEVMTKVRDNVNNARNKLPDSIQPPQVRSRGGGTGELMDIGVLDRTMSLPAVRDYLQRYVIDNLSQIPGVSKVNIDGASQYVMQVRLDPNKMAARHITVTDVQNAIKNSNLELPAGKIKGTDFDYPINVKTKLITAKQFEQIVVKQNQGNTIQIKDIGYAVMGPDPSDDSFVRVNNQPGIILNIDAADDANPIDVSNGIRAYIKNMDKQLPSGMSMIVAYDQSNFMRGSIHEVYLSIFFAVLCVLLVIYLFLGHMRSVSIPVVTIPICIFATFGVMYFLGFTINIITLLAIVLSIGLVVDDAIVMLENIHRHIENGDTPMAAAIKGSKEITFAVIAMTLTLAAVYAPVGLVHGKIAQIFKPFALTLAGAVIISGFVALTLSPMMCARLLKPHSTNSRFVSFLDRFFERMANGYQRILSGILNKRYLVMIGVFCLVVGGVFLVKTMSFTFMPKEDMGLVVAQITTPTGANAHYISDQTQAAATALSKSPAVQSVMSIAGTVQGGFNVSFATLKPFDQRKLSAQQVADDTNTLMTKVPGLNASAFPPSFGGSMKHQLEFSVLGNKSYKQLYQVSKTLVKQLEQYPGLKNIQSSLTFDSQQYEATVNRALAAKLNVSVSSVDNVLAGMLGGLNVSTVDVDGQTYNVNLYGLPKFQYSLDSLNDFSVTSTTGQIIPLSNLVTVKSVLSQENLAHYDRHRAVTIDAQLSDGYSLGQVVEHLNQTLPNLLPGDVKYQFQGRAKDSSDSKSSMGLIFILALVFIYLVLSAQFESFFDPFVILFAVPFSVFGALFALKMVDGSINIYTIVGLVTLIGLIAKHGILITQFSNELQAKGMAMKEALLKASSIRLRPILMTTAAMMFGVLPLIFSSGASAESRLQIGIVILSGLFFGTFFSLVLVPVIYSFINQFKQFLRRKTRPSA